VEAMKESGLQAIAKYDRPTLIRLTITVWWSTLQRIPEVVTFAADYTLPLSLCVDLEHTC
jgi:hypothetical protein